MGIANKLESALQGLIEGSFGRVFRMKLQPVEISRKLERSMEENLRLGPDRKLAPNLYKVYLSERDYTQFQPYHRSLAQQLSDGLISVARDRGYMLTSRPIVQFEQDDHMVTGQLHIDAEMLDAQAVAQSASPIGASVGLEETRAMSPEEARLLIEQQEQAAGMQADALPPAWLTLYRPSRGQPMRLEQQTIHIGRHLSNEIVVHDRRVSRYHAEIRFEHGQFVLFDLGSTNGVKVNGVATRQPVPLRNNDMITVGSHEFIFQRR